MCIIIIIIVIIVIALAIRFGSTTPQGSRRGAARSPVGFAAMAPGARRAPGGRGSSQ